mmetsp:Transcript_55875/g.158654  ORF Transcript_55875/g.158654 Transcript_55875/m.158654 type:complete len:264 (+) Transcript_55875:515-1306(+)
MLRGAVSLVAPLPRARLVHAGGALTPKGAEKVRLAMPQTPWAHAAGALTPKVSLALLPQAPLVHAARAPTPKGTANVRLVLLPEEPWAHAAGALTPKVTVHVWLAPLPQAPWVHAARAPTPKETANACLVVLPQAQHVHAAGPPSQQKVMTRLWCLLLHQAPYAPRATPPQQLPQQQQLPPQVLWAHVAGHLSKPRTKAPRWKLLQMPLAKCMQVRGPGLEALTHALIWWLLLPLAPLVQRVVAMPLQTASVAACPQWQHTRH